LVPVLRVCTAACGDAECAVSGNSINSLPVECTARLTWTSAPSHTGSLPEIANSTSTHRECGQARMRVDRYPRSAPESASRCREIGMRFRQSRWPDYGQRVPDIVRGLVAIGGGVGIGVGAASYSRLRQRPHCGVAAGTLALAGMGALSLGVAGLLPCPS